MTEAPMTAYTPRHPWLYEWTPRLLSPVLLRCYMRGDLGPALTEIGPGVFTFPMFNLKACADFMEEIDAIQAHIEAHKPEGADATGPNTVNRFDLVLEQVGFGALLDGLLEHLVTPLTHRRFEDVGGDHLDNRFGFVIDDAVSARESLDFHVDDSEVTVNLCLGERFEDGELYFLGPRCEQHRQTPARPDEHLTHVHTPGTAVLHRGQHRHGARPISSGRRRNLILWCSSSEGHPDALCPSWCGYEPPRAA